MANHRVLVVDDVAGIGEMVVEMLRMQGYSAHAVRDGNAALRYLEAATVLPSLILLDVMMPGMDGPAFRRHQLEIERIAHIPVVIVSGHGNVAKLAKELGVAGYLFKPTGMPALMEVTRRFCDPPAESATSA